MQRSFKKLRKMQILQGAYLFPTGAQTRLERARSGVGATIFFQGLTRLEVLKLVGDADWLSTEKVWVNKKTGETEKDGEKKYQEGDTDLAP